VVLHEVALASYTKHTLVAHHVGFRELSGQAVTHWGLDVVGNILAVRSWWPMHNSFAGGDLVYARLAADIVDITGTVDSPPRRYAGSARYVSPCARDSVIESATLLYLRCGRIATQRVDKAAFVEGLKFEVSRNFPFLEGETFEE
jgi:hypothetical protein